MRQKLKIDIIWRGQRLQASRRVLDMSRCCLQDSDTDSMYEQGTSTFCARNASYRGEAPATAAAEPECPRLTTINDQQTD